jgi:hypothetical protein
MKLRWGAGSHICPPFFLQNHKYQAPNNKQNPNSNIQCPKQHRNVEKLLADIVSTKGFFNFGSVTLVLGPVWNFEFSHWNLFEICDLDIFSI